MRRLPVHLVVLEETFGLQEGFPSASMGTEMASVIILGFDPAAPVGVESPGGASTWPNVGGQVEVSPFLMLNSGPVAGVPGDPDAPGGAARGPDAGDSLRLPVGVPSHGFGFVAEVVVEADVVKPMSVVVPGGLSLPGDLEGVPGMSHRSAGSTVVKNPGKTRIFIRADFDRVLPLARQLSELEEAVIRANLGCGDNAVDLILGSRGHDGYASVGRLSRPCHSQRSYSW